MNTRPRLDVRAQFCRFGWTPMGIYVHGHDLYCKNAERGNAIFKLRHITGNEFVLDENVQVEFKKDGSGKVFGLKMLWVYGNESFKSRNTI